ncbi:flavin reductase family protein [Kitasatospora sp. NPDC057198]|uniref:flavin reductase family protein n=1 Tax=Kitasatospora sp. NPDC057198 TaxID=3346046 RepID=UPI0036384B66
MFESATAAAPALPTATPDEFRAMMSGFPTGVCVVTGVDAMGAPRGMTVSSLCSVALDPPTLLVCLRAGSQTLGAALDRGGFTVNLLHEGARPTAELFGSGDPRRFALVRWEQDPEAQGPHLVRDAHTVVDCTVVLTQQIGDHVTVFGRARRIVRHRAPAPLLYGLRRFRGWSAA